MALLLLQPVACSVKPAADITHQYPALAGSKSLALNPRRPPVNVRVGPSALIHSFLCLGEEHTAKNVQQSSDHRVRGHDHWTAWRQLQRFDVGSRGYVGLLQGGHVGSAYGALPSRRRILARPKFLQLIDQQESKRCFKQRLRGTACSTAWPFGTLVWLDENPPRVCMPLGHCGQWSDSVWHKHTWRQNAKVFADAHCEMSSFVRHEHQKGVPPCRHQRLPAVCSAVVLRLLSKHAITGMYSCPEMQMCSIKSAGVAWTKRRIRIHPLVMQANDKIGMMANECAKFIYNARTEDLVAYQQCNAAFRSRQDSVYCEREMRNSIRPYNASTVDGTHIEVSPEVHHVWTTTIGTRIPPSDAQLRWTISSWNVHLHITRHTGTKCGTKRQAFEDQVPLIPHTMTKTMWTHPHGPGDLVLPALLNREGMGSETKSPQLTQAVANQRLLKRWLEMADLPYSLATKTNDDACTMLRNYRSG